jgi:uncharacterized OsmC-like protein
LVGEATGEIETEDKVLVIRRIHVKYLLRLDPEADRAAVQRAFDHHMGRCPVYRSIHRAIDVTTELELME